MHRMRFMQNHSRLVQIAELINHWKKVFSKKHYRLQDFDTKVNRKEYEDSFRHFIGTNVRFSHKKHKYCRLSLFSCDGLQLLLYLCGQNLTNRIKGSEFYLY